MFESDRERALANGTKDARSGKDRAPPGPRPGQTEAQLKAEREAYDSAYYGEAGVKEGKEGRLIGKTDPYKVLESHSSNQHRAKVYKQGYEEGIDRKQAVGADTVASSSGAASSHGGDSASSGSAPSASGGHIGRGAVFVALIVAALAIYFYTRSTPDKLDAESSPISLAHQAGTRQVYRCSGPPVLYTDAISAAEAQAKGCKTIDGAPVSVAKP
jgi:hypothetical protein